MDVRLFSSAREDLSRHVLDCLAHAVGSFWKISEELFFGGRCFLWSLMLFHIADDEAFS